MGTSELLKHLLRVLAGASALLLFLQNRSFEA